MIKFSLIVYVYGFNLFMRVCLVANNRSNPVSDFLELFYVLKKVSLLI